MKQVFKKAGEAVLEFIAPKICYVCDTRFESSELKYICHACKDNLNLAPPSEIVFDNIQKNFPPDDLSISSAFSLLNYSEVKEMIHSMKYTGMYKIGEELGKMLGRKIQMESPQSVYWDFVVPAPIHSAKKRERGYNQSDIIAKAAAGYLNVPFNNGLIYRSRYTITQTLLKEHQRKHNVEKAFKIKEPELVQNKRFLIIDDVLTTGSTLNSCGSTLLEAGARRVDIATLAIASL